MEEKKKSNAGLIVLIVILLLACAGMGSFIFINKDKLTAKENATTTVESDKKDTNEKTETTKEESKSQDVSNTKYCEGTYTFNDNLPLGDGELHKQVYTLKNDGTFSGSKNDTSKEEGTYIIKDDTIVFIYHPETYGGPDNASYTSASYYISSDCSYMSYESHKFNGNAVAIKLTK